METRRSANPAALSTDLRLPEGCCLSSDGEYRETSLQQPPQEGGEAIMSHSTASNKGGQQSSLCCREKGPLGQEVTGTDNGDVKTASPIGKTPKDLYATPMSVGKPQEDVKDMRVRSCSCNGETARECSTTRGGENRGIDTMGARDLQGNTQDQEADCRNPWSAAAAKSFLDVITRAKHLRADDSRVFGEASSNVNG